MNATGQTWIDIAVMVFAFVVGGEIRQWWRNRRATTLRPPQTPPQSPPPGRDLSGLR